MRRGLEAVYIGYAFFMYGGAGGGQLVEPATADGGGVHGGGEYQSASGEGGVWFGKGWGRSWDGPRDSRDH